MTWITAKVTHTQNPAGSQGRQVQAGRQTEAWADIQRGAILYPRLLRGRK